MSDESPRTPEGPRLRLGVSTCLLGEEVRHDGGHKRDTFLMHGLGDYVEWVPVCPEVEMGMGVPREALRLVGSPEDPRLVTVKTKIDHTAAMQRWSRRRLEEIEGLGLHGYVFKKNSPSCGVFRVRVYDANNVPAKQGRGIFAREFLDRFPLMPVEEEGRLNDARLRENFIERIFAHHRWKELLGAGPKARDLVDFHTAHKLTLMSHDPAAPARLGRLVAGAGRSGMKPLLEEYGRLLMEALARMATPRKHANVLQHLMGFLKTRITSDEKQELLELIDDYRLGRLPLVAPITLFKHHIRRHDVPEWVPRQVYLSPYPKELLLRNHV